MSRQVAVSEEIYKQFQAALILTGEEEQSVLNELITQYAHKVFENMMGKKTETAPPAKGPVVIDSIAAHEQKKMFINWFRGLTRNGKSYNPVTISGYAGRIENACFDPIFATVPVDNLFTVTDPARFADLQRQIKSCAGYAEFDARSHNGFTAALRKYEEFLRFQTSGHSIQPPPTDARRYPPSNAHRWTVAEDEICCQRFLECYVVEKNNLDTVQFLQMLAKEVPDISEGSLRMKVQNIKYLAVQAGLKDTSALTCLSQYSLQCEKAFKKAVRELGL